MSSKCSVVALLVTGGLLLFALFSVQNYRVVIQRHAPDQASDQAPDHAPDQAPDQALTEGPDVRDNAATTTICSCDSDRKFVDNFAERRARLERVCKDQPSTRFTRARNIRGNTTVGFSVCIVNKAASSTWRRFLNLLKTEGRLSLVSTTKWDIHRGGILGNNDQLNLYKQRGAVMKTRRVLTARNPYSRLWSAYVDKFFFPEFHKITRNIIRKYRVNATDKEIACGHGVTFNEFIRYVVDMNYKADVYTGHWLPVSDVCDPCTLRPDFIAKQETLGEDIKAIVHRLGLPYETDDLFVKAQLETTIRDELSYHIWDYDRVTDCVSKSEYLRHIWKGLVINGFLQSDAEFPEMFQKLPLNVTEISKYILQMPDIVTDTAFRNKLRNEAMVNAFKRIPASDLIGLQRLYRIDFLMFDYSTVSFL